MTVRTFQVVTTALLACAAFAACSNNQAPPAKAFVLATLGAAQDANHNNLCSNNSARTVLTIGTNTSNPKLDAVGDGDQSAGGTVNVNCRVDGSFDVSLNATLGGQAGGSLQIAGHVDASSGGQGLLGILNAPNAAGSFTQDMGCIITFVYNGMPVPDAQPIAAGRIWAHLSCPKMLNQDGHVVKLMDGTSVQETCDGEADFIFENCS